MTDILERSTDSIQEIEAIEVVSAMKQAIQAHLAAIHSEPEGRNRLTCSALMIGSPVVQAQVQV